MGEVAKTIYVYGIAALTEASYGAGGSPNVATDGVLLAENPDVAIGYANDGARPMPPGTMGYQLRTTPSGRTGSTTFKVMAAGAGAAYSASVKPRAHALFRAAGFDAVVATGAGNESYTYTPTPGPTGYASAVIDCYSRGEKQTLSGAYASLTITADGEVIPTLEFATQGLLALPTDVACPAIAYDTVVGPKSVGAGLLTLGNATGLILKKWQLKMTREITARLNQNTAAGHAGFAAGKRTPTLDLTVEATTRQGTPYTAATAIDPDQLFEHASALAWSITVGGVQYNRLQISGQKAQLMAPPKAGGDGPTATWDLSFQLNPSSLGANDDVTIFFN